MKLDTTQRTPYGQELILDLHGCDASTFNRASLDDYFETLCIAIKMEKCERYFWDDVGVPKHEQQTAPHAKGTSAVQFILTSSIVIHTLELLDAAYINIFSCKAFDPSTAEAITSEWFSATECRAQLIERI